MWWYQRNMCSINRTNHMWYAAQTVKISLRIVQIIISWEFSEAVYVAHHYCQHFL